jgi:hypothetical protein
MVVNYLCARRICFTPRWERRVIRHVQGTAIGAVTTHLLKLEQAGGLLRHREPVAAAAWCFRLMERFGAKAPAADCSMTNTAKLHDEAAKDRAN